MLCAIEDLIDESEDIICIIRTAFIQFSTSTGSCCLLLSLYIIIAVTCAYGYSMLPSSVFLTHVLHVLRLLTKKDVDAYALV